MSRLVIGTVLAICGSMAVAEEKALTSFTFNGERVTITQATKISAAKIAQFATLPASCDGPCVDPMIAARGVITIGERELLDFLNASVEPGTGLVIDARPQEQRRAGYIPSSINIPLATIQENTPFRTQIFEALGGRPTGAGWNFANAYELVVFDTGPGTSDASQMLQELVAAGYPPQRLRFYRGGMKNWSSLGLSFTEPLS